MEPPSITYSGIQPVNYLGQIHKQNDTNFSSSHREVCKQLDIRQAIIREEHKQKGQEKLSKSSSYSKQLSQKVAQQLQVSQRGHYIRKGNTFASPENLECSKYQRKDIDSMQIPIMPRVIRRRNRRPLRRKIRHVNTLNRISRLSIQYTDPPFTHQFFNGSSF
ncbi:uncharacterized protein OCT59_007138 [Rhizophagus irregularis]|uniref:Uncharacterized protein n=2 Tax=Rhizophagus irregularis TaxID=588596 RepID=U9TNT2_RHIID|nr:hypothetical protein GLOIN_2v1843351 [Rhizophagus irregularis DAOM 181602=DAOM 197198]EXX51508.1 hypothetical protein RirG_261330 [Rhizophagus irregularis DAOM 197198w]UZO15722.1 hypothetical protein OCT59_007138 [Rhizophagus irregularis]POG67784.1 hypothetical protein GLOIN_2v1843351 [Rhizophagus irregularis DAOM 181602=DAOM 197198]CAG8733542.1 19886_t:CDS:2 [Rhizophagus irregularis]GBC32811.1 hypothetical protein GLOIN_2v1843351 [Rhizophagus irregularis DAOM 181602=DAOM 197198]|eukprot:XP_025174650.1 hypothetical protein GLOIN_2v1843351 [Rhizophagus irregularis DAOM 181602=DAOM 197198]